MKKSNVISGNEQSNIKLSTKLIRLICIKDLFDFVLSGQCYVIINYTDSMLQQY